MICSRCKIDKDVCLFTPWQLRISNPRCRKCLAELNGHTFGGDSNVGYKKHQYGLKKNEAIQWKIQDFKKAEADRRQQELLEQRRKRLEGSK